MTENTKNAIVSQLNGSILTVRIPEQDIDKKALYTILADKPDFVLPFRHKAMGGEIEFTYQVGSRSKLTHLPRILSPNDYADLWLGLLQPLLDCSDWFMNPYSFVLKSEHLYCDKNSRLVGFVYIPSTGGCSDYNMLRSMVVDVAKQNHVTDANFENKVLWAMQDFNPDEFLRMIKSYRPDYPKEIAPQPQREQMSQIPKDKNNFWDKKPPQQEIVQRAATTPNRQVPIPIYERMETAHTPPTDIYTPPTDIYTSPVDMQGDLTLRDIHETNAPKFRYVGTGEHPRVIEITATDSEIYTIGRFDVSKGVKQSDFEFDKKTKAVSRRHAMVKKSAEGYNITDLDSSAGTFVNGQKLTPNVPCKLERGWRVSFGHAGADYVWEA